MDKKTLQFALLDIEDPPTVLSNIKPLPDKIYAEMEQGFDELMKDLKFFTIDTGDKSED
ncbi:MAG: hypothetical protein AB2795_20615 [Candidatus Thiodiazotropha endolucinida]